MHSFASFGPSFPYEMWDHIIQTIRKIANSRTDLYEEPRKLIHIIVALILNGQYDMCFVLAQKVFIMKILQRDVTIDFSFTSTR